MLNNPEDAAALLWRHWMDGSVIDALPAGLRPETRAQGYAIQACLEGFSAKPLAGWKIAATSAAGQAHINVDGPIAGRLLAERLRDDGASVSIANNRMRACEPEFAFRFAEDVPPRAAPYSVEEALARVGDLHLTIELPDSRFTDFCAVGAPSLIADDACAEVLIVGPRIDADWRALDLARYPVRAEVKGRYDREGSGANVLSDPRIALAWLVNEVTQMGITLRRGELVTTGTCMVPLEVEPGDVVSADFGALGRIGVRISDDG